MYLYVILATIFGHINSQSVGLEEPLVSGNQGFLDDCEDIKNLPNPYYLKGQACEGWWHNTVLITRYEDTEDNDEANILGYYQSICMSFNQDVELVNKDGDVVGRTDKQTAFEWGTHIDIYDCNDQIVYVIEEADEEVITNRLNPVSSSLQIYNYDANRAEKGDMIGFIAKNNLLDTEIIIQNMDEDVIITAEKSLSDALQSIVCIDTSWTIQTSNSSDPVADPKIISFFVALEEVQDLSDGGSDSCTTWTIVGYVVLAIVCLIILLVGSYCMYGWIIGLCSKKDKSKTISIDQPSNDDNESQSGTLNSNPNASSSS